MGLALKGLSSCQISFMKFYVKIVLEVKHFSQKHTVKLQFAIKDFQSDSSKIKYLVTHVINFLKTTSKKYTGKAKVRQKKIEKNLLHLHTQTFIRDN